MVGSCQIVRPINKNKTAIEADEKSTKLKLK